MRRISKTWGARILLLVLLLSLVRAPASAASRLAGLEGLVLGTDGRPARGFRVHLIDPQGRDLLQATTGEAGRYAFREVPPGRYALGVESPTGQVAPVAAGPLRLGANEIAQRDVRLLAADPASRQLAAGANYGIGIWWAGLSPAAKVWTVVGIVAVAGITFAALDDDDDNEPASSPFN